MIDLKRILHPTDFSEHSQCAQAYAVEFARQFGAELHLVHVVDELTTLPPAPDAIYAVPQIDFAEVRRNAEAALARLSQSLPAMSKPVVTSLRTGPPLLEIVRCAKENDIDLIVLGTHGRTGLQHVLMGSVAENVVRKASCPVLTVRPEGHQFVMP